MKVTSIRISPGEFADRRKRLCEELATRDLSGAVMFDSHHILYYSGFAFVPTERPIMFVLGRDGQAGMFVPRLEAEHARAQTGFDIVDYYVEYPYTTHPMEIFKETLVKMDMTGAIGADQDGYPWILGYRGPSLSDVAGNRVEPLAAFVEDMMAIKSDAEIALIRESCKWGNLAHRLLQAYTRPGETETTVSQKATNEATLSMLTALGPLYQAQNPWSRGAGAGYRGQIGRNAAIPHALANNIVFQAGDVLVTGASAAMWGYNSELERTMVIGEPTREQRGMFDHMMGAQETALEAMRPGRSCADVDHAVRKYYEANDLMKYWKHHTGHAIGLRYHEGPFLDVGDGTRLEPGMVFTVEPGLYASDVGGFRHSDTVLMTNEGIELLTYYPRDLESLIIPV